MSTNPAVERLIAYHKADRDGARDPYSRWHPESAAGDRAVICRALLPSGPRPTAVGSYKRTWVGIDGDVFGEREWRDGDDRECVREVFQYATSEDGDLAREWELFDQFAAAMARAKGGEGNRWLADASKPTSRN